MKKVEAGVDKSKKMIEKVTGGDFTRSVANQYLPEHQRKFIGDQAPDVVTNKFGLGIIEEHKVLRYSSTSTEMISKQVSELQSSQRI